MKRVKPKKSSFMCKTKQDKTIVKNGCRR